MSDQVVLHQSTRPRNQRAITSVGTVLYSHQCGWLIKHMTKHEGAAMNNTFRLTLSFLMIACLAGLTKAHAANDRLDLAEFASHPETFAGRLIEVNAQVIAI